MHIARFHSVMCIIIFPSESSLNICTVVLYIKINNVFKLANLRYMKCNACHLYFHHD